jgi:hypothetical protein
MNTEQRKVMQRYALDEALSTATCDYTGGGWKALPKCQAWEPFEDYPLEGLEEIVDGLRFQFEMAYKAGFEAGIKT